MSWDNYRREERQRMEPGDHRVCIIDVEETVSRAGNDMLVLTLQPSGSKIKIKHYIVDNEYRNRNLTELFDSFDIEDGDMCFASWIGAVGAARLAEDDNGYLKVKFFINAEKAENLPEWQGEKPMKQTVNNSFAAADSDDFEPLAGDDDVPF